jgi:hypothetical protein
MTGQSAFVRTSNSNASSGMKKILVFYQGDQIGRIFAQRAIVNFGHFFENYKIISHFWACFVLGETSVLILTKRVGHIFGRYFHKLVWSPCLWPKDRFKKSQVHSSDSAGREQKLTPAEQRRPQMSC